MTTQQPAVAHLRGSEKLWIYIRWFAVVFWCLFFLTTQQSRGFFDLAPVCLFVLGCCTLLHVLTQRRLIPPWLTTSADLLLTTLLCGLSGGLQSPAYPYFSGVILASTLRFGLSKGLLAASASSGLSLLLFFLFPAASITGLTVGTFVLFLFLLAVLSGLLRPAEKSIPAPPPAPVQQPPDRLSALYRSLLSLDLDSLLQGFVDEIARQIPCRGVGLILVHPQQMTADRVAVAGQLAIPLAGELNASISSGVLGEVLQLGTIVIPTGQELRARFRSFPDMRTWAKRHLFLTRIQHSAPIGCLIVADTSAGDGLSETEERFLVDMAHDAAIAIENAWRFEKIQATTGNHRDLLHAVISVHEQEQKRVAEEWYERVGGKLFHVLREFRMFQEFLGQHLPESKDRFETLAAELDEVGALVRSLADELHPTEIDTGGFVAALHDYVAGLRQQESFHVTIQADKVDSQLPSDANLSLFRITQAAVHNIRRYARAKNVEIAFFQEHRGVSLMIKDDGLGFNPAQPHDGHYGLLYMRERAEACGGEFHVHSIRGQGTEIRVDFPLSGESEDASTPHPRSMKD